MGKTTDGPPDGSSSGRNQRQHSAEHDTKKQSTCKRRSESSLTQPDSSTSRSTPNKGMLEQIPFVPGAGSDVALLVIIDFTKSSEKLFNAVIDYVVNISEYMPKAKIGIVMISCPSKTLLEMGIYTEPEIRSTVTAPAEPLKEKGTAQALELGKKLLE
ncbi:hypothetical protein OSTOST_24382, partial [Ostertagia ostertagi]